MARQQAQAELTALEHGVQLIKTSTGDRYLLAGGFLPAHPVRLRVDGKLVAILHANPLGDVTAMLDPRQLHLSLGPHQVTLSSMLLTETATLRSDSS